MRFLHTVKHFWIVSYRDILCEWIEVGWIGGHVLLAMKSW